MASDDDRAGHAESDVSLALGAVLLGALVLGAILGVETQSELLLLLAVVAAVGLVFEKIALPAVRRRRPRRGRDGPP